MSPRNFLLPPSLRHVLEALDSYLLLFPYGHPLIGPIYESWMLIWSDIFQFSNGKQLFVDGHQLLLFLYVQISK